MFNNLALLFAIGVAIGMARQEKEVAALSGAIAYLVMNTAISAMITARGGVETMAANTTTSSLGITTLQMGVFGGIIAGLGVAALHNRFYKIRLPQMLSFFGGTRFVPIVCTAVFVVVGISMFFVWPAVQTGIAALGDLVIRSGYAGTWIYGLLERALIPFGLHHVFYMPFWQTAVGGTAVIDSITVQGAQNIFFAELASKGTQVFSVEATRFMAGKFPFMIFGLPGAALAMYRTARPERRKAAGGLLISAALTAMLTGITEPLEFTFLFVAPPDVRGPLRLCGPGIYADAHPPCRGGHDLLRRSHRPDPLRHPSGQLQDSLDLDCDCRPGVLFGILFHLLSYDYQDESEDARP